MNKEYIVYKIKNKENGKVYIGVTKDFKKRKYEHVWRLKNKTHPNWKLLNDFKDENDLEISVLEKCLNEEKFEREKYWISYFESNLKGYNLDDGGNKGKKRNDESLKVSIKKAARGKNNKMSRAVILVNTGEIFQTIKEAHAKYNFISYSLISQCCRGKIKRGGISKEGKALVWEYLENYDKNKEYNFELNDFFGSKNNNSKKILCIENNKEYGSLAEAARELNLKVNKISLVCNGKRKTTGGYKFKFLE